MIFNIPCMIENYTDILKKTDFSSFYNAIEANREEDRKNLDESLKRQNDDLMKQFILLRDDVTKFYERQQRKTSRLQWVITIISILLTGLVGYLFGLLKQLNYLP